MRQTDHKENAARGAPNSQPVGWVFANSYAGLPADFYSRVTPGRVPSPKLVAFNRALAGELSLDVEQLQPDALASIFSGNAILPGTEPLAMAYAGHQFGQFVPQLGDGRAILLGEVQDHAGRWRDIQLKGSGRTPYSRGGDGRAAIGPVLREYLVSEAMHSLGIPTTRALAVVTTGDVIFRQGPVPGAILTRVAASHIRVGTFQYFASRADSEATRRLADYVIRRHYPDLLSMSNPYLELLRAVARRQAQLVAEWMSVGFIHGVMNTDNTAISGETIDYGPCAFMDAYDPGTVFSSIDHLGRYAYANQPAAAQWNMARFAETLLPLIDSQGERAVEMASEVIKEFAAVFDERWLEAMRRKLGLSLARENDRDLIQELLNIMQEEQADFTLTFRGLCASAESGGPGSSLGLASAGHPRGKRLAGWMQAWRSRWAGEPSTHSERAAFMRSVNPAVIPRNHRVETIIEAAVEREDYEPFASFLKVLARPYETTGAHDAEFEDPPLPHEKVLQTFCGT